MTPPVKTVFFLSFMFLIKMLLLIRIHGRTLLKIKCKMTIEKHSEQLSGYALNVSFNCMEIEANSSYLGES